MVRGGPEHSVRVHQVTIGLKMHVQPAMLAMSQRRADCGWRGEPDAGGAAAARTLIVFVVIPFRATESASPILALDGIPNFRRKPSRTDGACVPAISRIDAGALYSFLVGGGNFGGAILESALAVVGCQLLDGFGQ